MSRRATVVFLVLVLATAVAWSVGGGPVGLAVVVVLGFAKAAVVGLEFMDLRRARGPERIAFLTWIGVVGSTCVIACVM